MTQGMLVIGLTGGIGMGKSTAAKILGDMGLPIYVADTVVHQLLRKGGKAVKRVAKMFPETLTRGAIDRPTLSRMVFSDPARLTQLEKILHPMVRDAELAFLAKARAKKACAAILEITLLFETNGQKRCDFTICVTAPKAVQKARVIQRPAMNIAKFNAILRRQMPDKQKRKLADYVVRTGTSYAHTRHQLETVLAEHNLIIER